MLERTCGHSWVRALIALAPLVLGACVEAAVAPLGRLELRGAPARGAPCAAAGELRLASVDGSVSLVVSGAELCAGAPRRHALPPGLYALTWRGYEAEGVLATGPNALQGPAVLGLFPGQLTRVHVQLEPAHVGVGAAPASILSTASAAPAACGHDAARAGAS